MNGLGRSRAEVKKLVAKTRGRRLGADVLLCPPATLLHEFREITKGSRVRLGGQDCHADAGGAHTGDLSAEMLADAGASFVIVGHSERRADHGESDKTVRHKAEAALRAGMVAVVCAGETAAERRSKKTLRVIGRQIRGSLPERATAASLVVAYEPVWAIGTGLTPTTVEVAEVHHFIRKKLVQRFGRQGERVRILYGGSVNPRNAAELLSVANVNGALVGGASLKAPDFLKIITAV
jgi:triosephosphate isomerase